MRLIPMVICCRRRACSCPGSSTRLCPRRLSTLPCCKDFRRRKKEKGGEEEEITDISDLELGRLSPVVVGRSIGNGQDPDELRPVMSSAAEVPGWLMPKLVVECSRQPGVRVHKGTSLILPEAGAELLAGVVAHLPVLLQIRPSWQLGYSMAVDGVSLRTMYRQVAEVGPCLFLVEDSNGCIFGAFLSEGLRPANQCYGTHECFVFRYPRAAGAWRTEVFGQSAATAGGHLCRSTLAVEGEKEQLPPKGLADGGSEQVTAQFEALRKCQAWVIAASTSQGAVFCDHTGIVIGIDGPALFIDQDLLRGVSWPSRAFGSPCLSANGPDFVVRNIEVWHWEN